MEIRHARLVTLFPHVSIAVSIYDAVVFVFWRNIYATVSDGQLCLID
jgi:hypothetical protein